MIILMIHEFVTCIGVIDLLDYIIVESYCGSLIHTDIPYVEVTCSDVQSLLKSHVLIFYCELLA